MAECYRCPYTHKIKQKVNLTSTILCSLERTYRDVTYYCKDENKSKPNPLCPFVNANTRFPGVDYHKYETEFLEIKEVE